MNKSYTISRLKSIGFLFLLLVPVPVFSQGKLKVIHSGSMKISIRDGKTLLRNYWTLTPAARPDVYETVVTGRQQGVTFITDKDSISFEVKAGKKYDFVILFNGKDSAYTQILGKAPVVIQPFSKVQMRSLETVVSTLNQVKATPKTEQAPVYYDLDVFAKAVGDAPLIALGESTHGTSEFFTMKHRVLEYAVVKMGVRVFALEDNQLNTEAINRYVLYGEGKLLEKMRGLFGVWVRQEVLDMINWVRGYNLGHPGNKVEFVGIDMQNPQMAFDSLDHFLGKKDPAFNKEIQALLEDYRKGFPNNYTATENEKKQWAGNTLNVLKKVQAERSGWLQAAQNRKDSIAIEWAVQNARVIRQSARGILTGQLYLYRDSAMAENIQWILEQHKPGTRMLIWAHDFHISRGDDPVAANNYYNGVSMGSWLSKWYGQRYKAFGIETYSGTFTAMKTYTDFELVDCALQVSPVGSLDEALHRVSEKKQSPFLFVDLQKLRASPRENAWICAPTLVRFANHVCEGNSYGLKHSLPYQFDGIFYIDKTKGSTLIK